jgi:hypothetical protein
VRVERGTETAVIRSLQALGARTIEQRPAGELRVVPSGPLRPYLDVDLALAIYAVRPLPGIDLGHVDGPAGAAAAQELSALVLALWKGRKPTTMRMTAGPDVVGDRAAIGRLAGPLARRLGLMPGAVSPDLVLILRRRGQELELCARLPLPRRDPPPEPAPDPPPDR